MIFPLTVICTLSVTHAIWESTPEFFYRSIKCDHFRISPDHSASDLDLRLCCPEQQVVAERGAVVERHVTCYSYLPLSDSALQRAGQKGTSQMQNTSFCPKSPIKDTKVKLNQAATWRQRAQPYAEQMRQRCLGSVFAASSPVIFVQVTWASPSHGGDWPLQAYQKSTLGQQHLLM